MASQIPDLHNTTSPLPILQRAATHTRSASRRLISYLSDIWIDEMRDLHTELAEDRRQMHCHTSRVTSSLSGGMRSTARFVTGGSKGATTFPKFMMLPAEIRLQIWEDALPEGRAVMLRSPQVGMVDKLARKVAGSLGLGIRPVGGKRRELVCGKGVAEPVGWTSSTPPPAMLHVCVEARDVALRHYTLALGTIDGVAPPRVYVNFETDSICLSRSEITRECDSLWAATADLPKVRHLAVSYWGYDRFTRLPLLWGRFTGLRDIAMVRSVRWQYGVIPRGAGIDFKEWCGREESREGVTRWFATWREGEVTIHDGSKEITHRDLALSAVDRWMES